MKPCALLTIACLVSATAATAPTAAQAAEADALFGAHRLSVGIAAPHTLSRGRRSFAHPNVDPVGALEHDNEGRGMPLAEPFTKMGAIQVYAWREGAIYGLSTALDEVSDIALQPGETLMSVAAGDTARWIIGDSISGSGSTRRAHILVKPAASGLRTNLLIATDRRVYHLDLASGSRPGTSGIAWSYADDPLIAVTAKGVTAEAPVSAGVMVDHLDFDYRIEGDRPSWRPVRAFDDGQQVFVEFPPNLAQTEAPPLFIFGDDRKTELVNYRVQGRYYVVDRLFTAAELRLGEKHQSVVRILHEGSRAGRRPS